MVTTARFILVGPIRDLRATRVVRARRYRRPSQIPRSCCRVRCWNSARGPGGDRAGRPRNADNERAEVQLGSFAFPKVACQLSPEASARGVNACRNCNSSKWKSRSDQTDAHEEETSSASVPVGVLNIAAVRNRKSRYWLPRPCERRSTATGLRFRESLLFGEFRRTFDEGTSRGLAIQLRFSTRVQKSQSVVAELLVAWLPGGPGSRVSIMLRLAVISGRSLMSFPLMLRVDGQAVKIHATIADISMAARLPFTERSPHRSHHDSN